MKKKNDNNKYSVALCTYNGNTYVLNQLQSIVYQTVTPNEIVVIDDDSDDNTYEIVKAFSQNIKTINWVIEKNEYNIGYVENFQLAIKKCSNETIFLSDQDDVWLPNKAQIILNKFETSKKCVLFTNASIVDEKCRDLNKSMFEQINFSTEDIKRFKTPAYQLSIILPRSIVTGATMAFRKSFILKTLPFPKSKNYIHDSWISTLASVYNELSFCEQSLIKYRQHDKNEIGISSLNTGKNLRKKSNFIYSDIQLRAHREIELYNFIKRKNLQPNSNVLFLGKRVEILKKIIDKKNNYINRVSMLSFKLYSYRIHHFTTIRMFVGNFIRIILNK